MKSSIYLLITLAIIYSPSTHTQTQASKELEELFKGIVNHCEDVRFMDDKPLDRITEKINSSSVNEVAEAFNNTQDLVFEKIGINPNAFQCYPLFNASLATLSHMNRLIAQGKGDELVKDIKSEK